MVTPRIRNFATFSQEEASHEAAHNQIAYNAALESIVLLKNRDCLPIQLGRIALFGAGARRTIKGGTGSGEVNERHSVNILEGLIVAGFQVTTQSWIKDYELFLSQAEKEYVRKMKKSLIHITNLPEILNTPFRYPIGRTVTENDLESSGTDTCIYVISRQAGEGSDRRLDSRDYMLHPTERENLILCGKYYKKTIVVINVGAPFDMSFVDEIPGIDAVVYYCQQGSQGGTALAELLCGKASPSGKLSDTWCRRYEDLPFAKDYSYLNGNLAEEYYKEGIYVGYRYFDTFGITPQYAFGYGLSYTDYSIETKDVHVEKNRVTLTIKVTNMGETYSGKEVVQVYVSCPQGALAKEYQKLVAFGKTKTLAPQESQTLELSWNMEELYSYSPEEQGAILEAGDYLVRVGNASNHTNVVAVLSLNEKILVERYESICSRKTPVEEIVAPVVELVIPEGVARYEVKAADIPTKKCSYGKPRPYFSPKTEELLKRLDEKDKIELLVGSGMFGGKKYFEAPGTVGNTTWRLMDKGIPNICMADGPAGLRLQKTSALTSSGKVKMIDAQISVMNYLPKFIKKFLFGNPKKDTLMYQFTTAFPVGLALAQTWNLPLIEEIGYAVSQEMETYGISYWLAPALNIHRNPLCGRNFEYYSEDPYLAGKMAAAMTCGVQKIPGNYTTIKHFCCNNQEDNRNKTNANINERALREIYLRGFEIAVKEAKPGAVMTSYNKVNGTYTPESYDLCTKVLRDEWGFEGLVMTDWFSTGKKLASEAKAVAAGNDLIMPGTGGGKRCIAKGLRSGVLSREDLDYCCANVLKGIVETDIYRMFVEDRK